MNGHVEASSDTGTLEGLSSRVLLADVHETGHLILEGWKRTFSI